MSTSLPTPELVHVPDTDAAAIIEAATRAADPKPLDDGGRLWSIVTPGGDQHVIDVEHHLENYRLNPRRKAGTFLVHDTDSFVNYLAKHTQPETEVWADVLRSRVVGVINAHEGTNAPVGGDGPLAGWGDHEVVFAVQHTDAWKAWTAYDGKLLSQAEFAEHIEARSIDIVKPTAADMLELAETFQANIGVNFESSQLLSTGERQFQFRETVDAKAGRKGQLSIPKQITLGLVPFEGAEAYKVTARFRYRITDGVLRLGYVLERPQDVVREAFGQVVEAISQQVEAPVFRGVSA